MWSLFILIPNRLEQSRVADSLRCTAFRKISNLRIWVGQQAFDIGFRSIRIYCGSLTRRCASVVSDPIQIVGPGLFAARN
jgi:hypothetical protein